MSGNPLVRFDEGRVGRAHGVALSPTLPGIAGDKSAGRRLTAPAGHA
jgi:hypothetical protein